MQRVPLEALLDDGAGELARILLGLGVVVGLALLLTAAFPLALLGARPAVSPRPPTLDGPISGEAAEVPSSQVVQVARRYLGVPYVFGGADPRTGLDCSGL